MAERADTRREARLEVLLLLLMGIVILLMVVNIGLFIRMNQLQNQVLAALGPLQVMRIPEGLEIGTKAPDFTLPDTAGQMISLDDFTGQRVLLAFSSARCPACVEMYPHLKAFSEGREDVQVVMISQGSDEENQQLIEEQGFAFPVLPVSGWDDEVMVDYQVPGTPFFYVIDEGMIVNKGFANTLKQLEELVRVGQ